MSFCDLKGKNIIVTGASSGLGRRTAVLLDHLNANVCIVGRNENELNNTLNSMKNKNHLVEPFDLCDFDNYRELFKRISIHMGALHGMVHFAGTRKTLPIKNIKIKHLNDVFNINVFAFFELVKQFTRKGIVDSDGASIIAASSVISLKGSPALSIYSSSKAALDGSIRSFASELASKNIRVNSVAPGHVETEMNLTVKNTISKDAYDKIINSHPIGVGMPIDISNLVAFLLSDEARWITGTTIPIDGGFLINS